MKKLIIYIFIFFFSFSSQIFAEIFEVDNNKIIKLMKNGVPLIDIRTEKEWYQTGIIKDSKTLTFFDKEGNFDIKKWMRKLKKIASEDDPLIIICRSGRRSRIVSNYLNSKAGYKTIFHATNGIIAWKDAQKKTIIPQ